MSRIITTEEQMTARLIGIIGADFRIAREVWIRPALHRNRMRVDVLAVPKAPDLSDLAVAFEVKAEQDWTIPELAKALKQAQDYVGGTIEVGQGLGVYEGKAICAAFVFPGLPPGLDMKPSSKDAFLGGMAHLASYSRVGSAYFAEGRGSPLVLRCPDRIWEERRGWFAAARPVLAGKRQAGSQRLGWQA